MNAVLDSLRQFQIDLHDFLAPATIWLTTAYIVVLAVLVIYGLHRYWLVYLFRCYGRDALQKRDQTPINKKNYLPRVTVQLPMFNESQVARRVIEAACEIEYPTELLQIQVLDDSTDDCTEIGKQVCRNMREVGHDVDFRHRSNRIGYKAGALEEAMESATGELIAVFDADFVPPATILRDVIDNFEDPEVGMVQTRWDHLNRTASPLTRCQAIFLDGHFVIEHTARNRAGRWFNFNGTAGVWRRECIADAGGWQHDTLTEDVDLSYRAQMKGWKFVYDPSVECPAELPPRITAFNSQQHRWSKGSVQTAIKLLPSICRSSAPASTKIEAWFHLTSPVVYLFVFLLSLLIFPAFFVHLSPTKDGSWTGWLFGGTLLALATCSAGTFYVASQQAQGRGILKTILHLPMLMALGIGISFNNTRAVLEALLNIKSPFVRTPKYAGQRKGSLDPAGRGRRMITRLLPSGVFEAGLGILLLAGGVLSLATSQSLVSLPFLLLFAVGYLWVGFGTIYDKIVGAG